MQTVFEEMWPISLELQIATYPVVNSATVTFAGYPNFEIGTDMDQDITAYKPDLTKYKDYSVHNTNKPVVVRYPLHKFLQQHAERYVPVPVPGSPAYNHNATTCVNFTLPGLTGTETMSEIVFSWYIQFNRRKG